MAVIKSVEEKYMKEALKQAKKAYALGEVPIGCVIVHEGKIIGRGYNRRNTDKNTLAHAEITAIKQAAESDSYGSEEFAHELDDVCRSYNMTVCVMDVNSNMKYVSINGGRWGYNRH